MAVVLCADGVPFETPVNPTTRMFLKSLFLLFLLTPPACSAGCAPYNSGYHGLGDVTVVIFFGFVATGGMRYIHCGGDFLAVPTAVASAQVGLLCAVLLAINNLRDVATAGVIRACLPTHDHTANESNPPTREPFNASAAVVTISSTDLATSLSPTNVYRVLHDQTLANKPPSTCFKRLSPVNV